MNRLPVFWVGRPDEDDPSDDERSIAFRVTDDWLAVDSDQLILPVTLLARDGNDFQEGKPGLLKQYGGESLLNDLLLADADLSAGSTWVISYDEDVGFNAYPTNVD